MRCPLLGQKTSKKIILVINIFFSCLLCLPLPVCLENTNDYFLTCLESNFRFFSDFFEYRLVLVSKKIARNSAFLLSSRSSFSGLNSWQMAAVT